MHRWNYLNTYAYCRDHQPYQILIDFGKLLRITSISNKDTSTASTQSYPFGVIPVDEAVHDKLLLRMKQCAINCFFSFYWRAIAIFEIRTRTKKPVSVWVSYPLRGQLNTDSKNDGLSEWRRRLSYRSLGRRNLKWPDGSDCARDSLEFRLFVTHYPASRKTSHIEPSKEIIKFWPNKTLILVLTIFWSQLSRDSCQSVQGVRKLSGQTLKTSFSSSWH